jgi:hypothetical protein
MNSSVKGGRVKEPGRWFEPGNGSEHSGSEPIFANIRIQKTPGSIHFTIKSQGGCAVEVICFDPQYW